MPVIRKPLTKKWGQKRWLICELMSRGLSRRAALKLADAEGHWRLVGNMITQWRLMNGRISLRELRDLLIESEKRGSG